MTDVRCRFLRERVRDSSGYPFFALGKAWAKKRYERIVRPACFSMANFDFYRQTFWKNKGLRPNKKASEKSEACKLY